MTTDSSTQTKIVAWEKILRKGVIVIGRLALAYLFFTQLFWKMPPTFGCPPDFAFTTGAVEGGRVQLQRTSGLCDWIGIEAVWSTQPRPFFVANLDNQGAPEIAIDLGWAARLNGLFIKILPCPTSTGLAGLFGALRRLFLSACCWACLPDWEDW